MARESASWSRLSKTQLDRKSVKQFLRNSYGCAYARFRIVMRAVCNFVRFYLHFWGKRTSHFCIVLVPISIQVKHDFDTESTSERLKAAKMSLTPDIIKLIRITMRVESCFKG